MKKIIAVLLCIIMVFSMTACGGSSGSVSDTPEPDKGAEEQTTEEPGEDGSDSGEDISQEMLANGDFSAGTESWGLFLMGGDGAIEVGEDEVLKVDINTTGAVEHGVQLYHDGFSLETGCVYKLSFDTYCSTPCVVEWRIQINGGDYHAYAGNKIELTEEKQTVECEFEMKENYDPAPRLCINMGNVEGNPEGLGKHSIYFDNFSLKMIDDSNKIVVDNTIETPDIQINQVGYRPSDEKVAVFRDASVNSDFTVVNAETGDEVFSGKLTDEKENPNAGETNTYGDFSGLTQEGTYKIKTADGKESYEFRIAEDVYDDLMKDLLKMLYLQRCGTALDEETAGDFAHEICHTSEAVVYDTDKKMDVSGGWHDAGDYGRYVVPGAKTVMDLMLAYETNPAIFGDDTGIPESGNGVPDILDECRYELEWMLKMQDDESGGVYHKVTCSNFPETVMPEKEVNELILAPISNTATGDFSAALARAYIVYKDIDAEFAKKCLAASEKAYKYLSKAIGGGFVNPPSIATGEYPDGRDIDERFFAACELYGATGKTKYKKYMEDQDVKFLPRGLGWASVATYAFYDYLKYEPDGKLSDTIKDILMQQAQDFEEEASGDGYNCTLGDNYPWGSNMSVSNNGVVLAMAKNRGLGDHDKLMKQQLDYLLGRNATSYCFISGYGTLSPEHPHHRPSQFVGHAVKGMVIGGPNMNLDDPYAKATLLEMPPAKCYVDNDQSYSCNEVSIYWNSPTIYLLAEILK